MEKNNARIVELEAELKLLRAVNDALEAVNQSRKKIAPRPVAVRESA